MWGVAPFRLSNGLLLYGQTHASGDCGRNGISLAKAGVCRAIGSAVQVRYGDSAPRINRHPVERSGAHLAHVPLLRCA